MDAVKQTFLEDRRLVVLRFLAEDKAYRLNTSVIRDAMDAIGHAVSRDEVETLAAWLAEQGLVETAMVGPVRVVTLTERGLDVATGRARVPGVKRPAPR